MKDDDKEDGITFRLQNIFDLRYASKDEVRLIRVIVFGFVGLVLTAVVMSLLYGVLKLHA